MLPSKRKTSAWAASHQQQGTKSQPEHEWGKQLVSGINPETLKQSSVCGRSYSLIVLFLQASEQQKPGEVENLG